MLQNDLGPFFPLGRIILTPGAKKLLSARDVLNALLAHMLGGRDATEQPLRPGNLKGCRTLNVYRASAGSCFWIITEANQKRTTVMMPEEF